MSIDKNFQIDRSRYDDANLNSKSKYIALPGINEELVRKISADKNEPEWMLKKRLKALELFEETPMPKWGPDLSELNFDKVVFYVDPDTEEARSWDDVPDDIKATFEKLGIPQAERESLAGVGGQYDSGSVYHNLKEEWEKQGIIFENMDVAVQKYPEMVKKYFMTNCVPITDHKFAMLHAAVWSGGCLPGNSKIFMENSEIKNISDIQEGDFVLTLNENKRKFEKSKVLAKINNGIKEVFEICVGGRTLEATENHKFLCLEKSNKKLNDKGKKWFTKWKELKDISEGDILAIPKKIPNFGEKMKLPKLEKTLKPNLRISIKVPDETNDDLMWFLGFYVGDGCSYFPNENICHISLAIPDKDKELRKYMIELIEEIFNYEVKVKSERDIRINSKQLGNWIKDLNLDGGAKTKRIPNWIFGLPISQKMSFLAGLLDSDGFVEPSLNSIRFELANEDLIKDIKLLAISCGLYSDGKILKRLRKGSLLKRDNRIIKGGSCFSCRISGRIKEIPSRNEFKINKLNQIKKYTFDKYNAVTGMNFISMTSEELGFARLKSKKKVGKKEVFDIQVEDNHNFIANGIVAHNSFIYVPPGVKIDMPLQAYFRMNAMKGGQFEHTLIIADKGSEMHYLEGCSSPRYEESSLHAGCVEIHVMERAKVKYSSIENWSKNMYNLNTKRAIIHKNGKVDWLNGQTGSGKTMLYPCSILLGEGSSTESLGIAFAGAEQDQDTGTKVVHIGANTTSVLKSKSISKDGGISSYRGLVKIGKTAKNAVSSVECDALMIDDESVSNTFPSMEVEREDAQIVHEAKVGKIGDDEIFYLMARGFTEEQAKQMIVTGFAQDVIRRLPLEYAVELNKLIELEMEDSLG